jgi:uncharacterized protein (TIGR02246 family)
MSPEEEIRHVMAAYVQAHDRYDTETILSLFAPDGLFAAHAPTPLPRSGEYRGHEALRKFFDGSRATAAANPGVDSKLVCSMPLIEVDGDVAEATTDVIGVRAAGGDWTVNIVAQYADKFVRRGGRWLYAEKHVNFVRAPSHSLSDVN